MVAGTGGLGSIDQLKKMTKVTVPDHRPLKLNADDYHRVQQIPKKKVRNVSFGRIGMFFLNRWSTWDSGA
jgi:hypothetical protein